MGASLLGASIAPQLSESKAKVFALEEVELLERVDLLDPLIDHLKPPIISFLAILLATAPHKGA